MIIDLSYLDSIRKSKTLDKGSRALLERDRDKNPVVALREIAENCLDLEATKSDLVKGFTKSP